MMGKGFDVVALGELLIDWTQSGVSAQGNNLYEANPGGAPCNVLAMLRRFYHNVSFIGKVGQDHFGRYLSSVIKEVGIDTSGLVYDESNPTTLAFVHTKAGGERDFSFYRKNGADAALKKSDINTSLLDGVKIFHFGSLSLTRGDIEEATRYCLDIAKSNGAMISFDPNLREPLWDSLSTAKKKIEWGMSECDFLKISDNEIEFMTGEEDIDRGVNALLTATPARLICATLGKDGVNAYWRGSTTDPLLKVSNHNLPKVKVIEKTGAGDTFCGTALHYLLINGLDSWDEGKLLKMTRVANAAASLITTKKGALRVMPTVEEIETLLGEKI